jgi:hypothetical protein
MLATAEWPPGGISILAKSSNDTASVGRSGDKNQNNRYPEVIMRFQGEINEK